MREPIYYQTRPVNLASIAADSHGPWALRILGSSREVSVVSPNCSIGTARNNTVVLSDPYVSKHHCSLVARQGAIWIQV
jgi:pSer/pThr/pTyr-binding forkhead associated (FHA) protein